MKSERASANARFLMLLTSALAGCGGSGEVSPTTDAAGDSAPGLPDADLDVVTQQDAYDDSNVDAADAGCSYPRILTDAGCECQAPYTPLPDGTCLWPSIRRPFLVGSSLRSAAASFRADWMQPSVERIPSVLEAKTQAALAASWLKDGLEEHASIAAFARFTMQLLSLGAPPELVAASQRASLDEVQHARACFTLATRYHGRPLGPSNLAVQDTLTALTLTEIAALAVEEGCVGETLGALLAREQLRLARDRDVVAVLRRLARDEERHADLAWRFLGWAIKVGGQSTRAVIEHAAARAIRATRAMETVTYDVDLDTWHAHGRLTCEEARACADQAIREVVEPCLTLALRSRNPGSTRSASIHGFSTPT